MKAAFSSLKFVAGFLSNMACQTARGAANLVRFATLGTAAIARLLLAALQLMGGGGDRARESAALAWSMMKSSAKSGGRSALQLSAAISLVSPLLRAAQACSERMRPCGVYAPAGRDRNLWQDILGLNCWAQEPEPETKQEPPRQTRRTPREATRRESYEMPLPKPQKDDRGWLDLASAYVRARTVSEMDEVRLKMAVRHPVLYKRALEAARKASRRRAAA